MDFCSQAKYIMWNAGLGEAQAGIKIAGRNINNLRYADDTTLMAESEELKSLLMKVKEESKKAGSLIQLRDYTTTTTKNDKHMFHLQWSPFSYNFSDRC